jgi:hypothetical protein
LTIPQSIHGRFIAFVGSAVAVLALAVGGASAAPVVLLPGVTFDQTVQFTPHGAVVLNVITAPLPGSQAGLYRLVPALGHGSLGGGGETLTGIERDLSSQATVAGVDADFTARTGRPVGVVMQGRALEQAPLSTRSSIGIDAAGALHVDRVSFFGTWRGTGQRRPVRGLNAVPAPGQVALFTPAYGARVPVIAGSAEAVLEPFATATAGVDLVAPVTTVAGGGGTSIPADGAVLVAAGPAASVLTAEAPVGTQATVRLVLQPAWDQVTDAFGGGPLLVRNGKAIFRTVEDFTSDQVTGRDPRAAIGQLADGRVVLVAVDGGRPGYSVGLTSFELAQVLVRLGAVTAAGLQTGAAVGAAFDGRLLDRPSGGVERPIPEAALVEYFGVYAPPAPVAVLTGDASASAEALSYKLVRPSTVTARLVSPDGSSLALVAAQLQQPGVYTYPVSTFDTEGTWHWNVQATDDLGRPSVMDRSFRYDTTLRGLKVPKLAHGQASVGFTLSRPASVKLQIETRAGVAVRSYPAVRLPAGPGTLTWDGILSTGTRAPAGTYVAHLDVSSAVGASDLSATFTFAD